ncbi:MAG: sporulation transcriptional regulator SpoIIID [Oscillospiraceae bacterium]|nr:sporulation transcriptional regulator SpoIIID [Oscillospiraceae bacterium]
MYKDIEERSRALAAYLLEHQCTVRAAAERFGVSKSTVHKDMSERLEYFDRALWLQVRALLERNKAERHIRGGLATRRKYRGE